MNYKKISRYFLKFNKLNLAIIIGLLAIVGILIAQLLWTKQAFMLEDKKFTQKVQIALLEVTKNLYEGINHDLPADNPVQKMANDYYIVNIENDFEPKTLEFYLKKEFARMGIITDFEYAVYNCESEEMVYGNYVSTVPNESKNKTIYFPKHKNLIYYFAIRFPNQTNYLFKSLTFWMVLSMVLIVILILYCYSIFMLLQQRKYADLQRDFINNMTHEFKTPLASILIASRFLKNQPYINQEPKLSKYNQIIIDQGEKLNTHIEKILSMSKTELEPFKLDFAIFDIIELIKDTIQNIEIKNTNANITIVNTVDTSKIFIKTDAFHFSNLVYNLLENAIKYCRVTPIIDIRLEKYNNSLRLVFIDNGIGIPSDKQQAIFEKFVRLETKTLLKAHGFGLGLHYVKKICKLQKWTIMVSENKPFGSIFTIEIPTEK